MLLSWSICFLRSVSCSSRNFWAFWAWGRRTSRRNIWEESLLSSRSHSRHHGVTSLGSVPSEMSSLSSPHSQKTRGPSRWASQSLSCHSSPPPLTCCLSSSSFLLLSSSCPSLSRRTLSSLSLSLAADSARPGIHQVTRSLGKGGIRSSQTESDGRCNNQWSQKKKKMGCSLVYIRCIISKRRCFRRRIHNLLLRMTYFSDHRSSLVKYWILLE